MAKDSLSVCVDLVRFFIKRGLVKDGNDLDCFLLPEFEFSFHGTSTSLLFYHNCERSTPLYPTPSFKIDRVVRFLSRGLLSLSLFTETL